MSIPSVITKISRSKLHNASGKILFSGAPELSWMVWVMNNARPVNENKNA